MRCILVARQAHDEQEEARPGDEVRVTQGRPKSKWKHFDLVEVIRRNPSSSLHR